MRQPKHTLSAIVGGYHVAFLIGAILVVAAMAVAFIVLKYPAHTPATEAVNYPRDLPPVATEPQV